LALPGMPVTNRLTNVYYPPYIMELSPFSLLDSKAIQAYVIPRDCYNTAETNARVVSKERP